ncbi:MAG: hypothetical protein Q9227_005785 [Pyrenula ochraceoflavens]
MHHVTWTRQKLTLCQTPPAEHLLRVRTSILPGIGPRGQKRKASSIPFKSQPAPCEPPRQIRRVFIGGRTELRRPRLRGPLATVRQTSTSHYFRSDFANQPFTSTYEPGLPTKGPLASASNHGSPRLTPKSLKTHLDDFVVGQDRAKRTLSVAVFNHYQRIQENQRRLEEEEELEAKRQRRESHPVEEEFPGQRPTIRYGGSPEVSDKPIDSPVMDTSPLALEKSNLLLLGPSGVGKTLMVKSLARILSVPFSISDCTPFTQAGYIGEDVDVCVHRLLAAADYDVSQAERGIICLDELDKVAAAPRTHGKDVGGEGVQQALLKIIEGTTVQVTAKGERNTSKSGGQLGSTNSSLGSTLGGSAPPQKGEVYNVRTDDILFVCSGAFTGLQKVVMDRISKGSMGFGKPVKSSSGLSSLSSSGSRDTTRSGEPSPVIPGSEEEGLYRKYLPFFTAAAQSDGTEASIEPPIFNPLDFLNPEDLQNFGFIPELIGRIPKMVALSPLSHSLLLRILTEPRNSLLNQYKQTFQLWGTELHFTTPALHCVASRALAMNTGARALRTEMEAILGDANFELPGTNIKYALVTERVAKREEQVLYFHRGRQRDFHALIAAEEGEWEDRRAAQRAESQASNRGSFEEWRGKATAAGAG